PYRGEITFSNAEGSRRAFGVGKRNLAPIRDLAQQRLKERRFPCAVGADDSRHLAAVQMHGNILQHGKPFQRHRQMFKLRTARPARGVDMLVPHESASSSVCKFSRMMCR